MLSVSSNQAYYLMYRVVGASITAPGPAGGYPRAFLWHKGRMSDLNTLIQGNSPMYLLTAFSINDQGQIVGVGVLTSGADAGTVQGFLLPRGERLEITQRSPSQHTSAPQE